MFKPEEQKINEQNIDSEIKLESSRFVFSPETIGLLKQAREHLKTLQKNNPEIKGMGFIGSRMVNREHNDSDLDCLLFYDGSKYDKWKDKKPVYDTNTGEHEWKEVDLIEPIRHDLDLAYGVLSGHLYRINFDTGTPVQYEIFNTIDISEYSMKDNINKFRELIKEENYVKGERKDLPHRLVWRTVALFFMSIGEDVYIARRKFLQELESLPDGEKLWQEIIKCISWIERDAETEKRYSLPKYNFYPATISEAKKFFITKS